MNKFFQSVPLIVIFITSWIGAPAHAAIDVLFRASECRPEFRLVSWISSRFSNDRASVS